ncbi:MAG TPA: hypothetical protein VM118_07300 [Acidobacteriota bacterium]|nr:hypothetical protein [Acidobacteriota bacterium]
MSREVLNALESGVIALAEGRKGLWDKATKNGTIQMIEILSEKTQGEGATVRLELHLKHETTKVDSEPPVLEDGRWKVTIG